MKQSPLPHPRRKRKREHLTQEEVAKIFLASKDDKVTRNPERDYCLLFLMARHGLRASEACQLTLADVDLKNRSLHVTRLKRGKPATHPLFNGEVKAINDWLAVRPPNDHHELFISERRTPLTRYSVWVMVRNCAKAAGLATLNVHPHMLRHACGYDLANRGADTRLIQGYLGHQNIQHTVRYTELDQKRFQGLYPLERNRQ
jgi:site-specific recombinase XerD